MKVYKAVEFIGLLSGGTTHPWKVKVLVENEKRQQYAIKVFNANTLTQYNPVAHEVIANRLANLLDLHVPDMALIEFDEDFLETVPKPQREQIMRHDNRPKFGTVLIDNTKIYGQSPQPALEAYEYEDIYAFDNLIYNIDRRQQKPNILFRLENYYLIDHELSFEGISENTISDIDSNTWKYNYQRHIFHPVLKRRQEKERLFENFEYSLISLNINELEEIFLILDAYGYSYENQGTFLNYLRHIQANYRKFVTILKGQLL